MNEFVLEKGVAESLNLAQLYAFAELRPCPSLIYTHKQNLKKWKLFSFCVEAEDMNLCPYVLQSADTRVKNFCLFDIFLQINSVINAGPFL